MRRVMPEAERCAGLVSRRRAPQDHDADHVDGLKKQSVSRAAER